MLAQAVTPLQTPDVEWSTLTPVLVLLGGAVLLLVVSSFLPRKPRFSWHALVTVAIAAASIAAAVPLWFRTRDDGPMRVVGGAVIVDGLTVFLSIAIAVSVILTVLSSVGYLRRERLDGPEAYVLLLLSAAGGMIMCGANDLLVLFLGIEILSLAVYVLAGIHVRRARSGEAAFKYFLLGGVASAFLLYGIAFTYGATGTTNLVGIASFLSHNLLENNVMLLAGMGLLLVGLGFKVAAAPFHSWAPDVYEGSPSPVVGYMAAAVKTAAFAGFVRVFVQALGTQAADWKPMVYALAVLTLLVGSVFAVSQTNVKRMLAYSSISHAGFILIGIQAATQVGVQAVAFYLATYTFTVAGSFGVVSVIGRRGDNAHDLEDYRGLHRRAPLLAFAFLIFLLAQAGVPLTSGFFAKFYVLEAAVQAHSYWLALVAMLSSVISAFVYLRIVLTMYGEEPVEGAPTYRTPAPARLAIVVAVLATIGFGVLPGPLLDAAGTAVRTIAPPASSTTAGTGTSASGN